MTKRPLMPSDIRSWASVDSIAKTLSAIGFEDAHKIDAKRSAVPFSSSPTVALQIIETDKGGQAHLRDLNNRTHYLLLATSDYEKFTFVKQAFTAAGTPRPLKFQFSKSKNLDHVVTKLRTHLVPSNPSALVNLFDTKEVVKKFYREYKILLDKIVKSISGIPDMRERRHYAELTMYRLMFCYFIQTRQFISDDPLYFRRMLSANTTQNFYDDFLCTLFFNVLNTQKKDRNVQDDNFRNVPFLNGGLFRRRPIEEHNQDITIPNDAFALIFEFLGRWAWYADDDEEFNVNGVNPEILGHIFEQTLTDRASKGAYYTPVDVTNFITRSTIKSYCVDRVNDEYKSDYNEVSDVLKNPDHATYLYFSVLCPITVLDNACGSGEFLLSASKVLAELYSDVWDAIEHEPTQIVVQEQRRIRRSGSQKHYFQRRIITHNLYGVDMEEEAIEICKLRLWLSLISGVDRNSVEPLPNIDYNIVAGNSLTGYSSLPDKYQQDLDGDASLLKKIDKIDKLKHLFNNESDPARIKSLSAQIDSSVSNLTKVLNKLRINEISVERTTKTRGKKINPRAINDAFHYTLGFGDVVNNHGGFDVIIGNPPYVEQRKLDYPTSFFLLSSCKNVYAYFFEVSLNLLRKGGRLGYIVPVSSVSTERMAPLQDFLLKASSEIKISNYDDRPGRIFEGLEHCRSSIILCKVGQSKCKTHTTGYVRWHASERHSLFGRLGYTESSLCKTPTAIPKIANTIELDIMNKLAAKTPLGQHAVRKSPHAVWYHNAPQYWIRGMDFIPMFAKGRKKEQSSHVKTICLKDNNTATTVLSILNSSLFYWYFIKVSDCRDLALSDIKSFPCNIDELPQAVVTKLKNINKKLMESYQENSYIKTIHMKQGQRSYQEFRPHLSKHIADRIDEVLASHYGLTDRELNYIQNFDLSYRMGDRP